MTNEKIIENIDLEDFKAIRVTTPGVLLFNKETAYFFQESDIMKGRNKLMTELYGLAFPSKIAEIGDLA